ncbi:MAG TPA: DNA-binding transcriptional regulator [Tepidisphaeraceae bacterium]|nr:DNA-binding transcriptional regulator [Tepidisphaeraceae bacterium]
MNRRRALVGVAVDAAMGFGRDVLRGAVRYANARRKWLLHEEIRACGPLVENWPECDGAIVGISSPSLLEQIRRGSRHIVSCSGNADPGQMPVVCIDDEAVGRVAADHLINCRVESFGFYGRVNHTVSSNRQKGFCARLAAHGYTDCQQSLIEGSFSYGWTARPHWPRLIEWLNKVPKPIGILAMDDMAARDVAAACFSAGISIPERVALLGVNDDDLLCGTAWPPLSSVAVDFTRVGEAAARLLDRLLSGENLTSEQKYIRLQPLGVVARASTDILAVQDENLAKALRYIREHACDPCSVGDVLQHLPVGRRWLERQFVQKLGRTPHDEIIRVRMEMARRLLIQSSESLPQIASRCGFTAVQNFSRAFRDSLGVTPAAYRRSPETV